MIEMMKYFVTLKSIIINIHLEYRVRCYIAKYAAPSSDRRSSYISNQQKQNRRDFEELWQHISTAEICVRYYKQAKEFTWVATTTSRRSRQGWRIKAPSKRGILIIYYLNKRYSKTLTMTERRIDCTSENQK